MSMDDALEVLTSPFLRLPLELRLLIYHQYALDSRQKPVHRVTVPDSSEQWWPKHAEYEKAWTPQQSHFFGMMASGPSSPPPIAMVSRQVYREYMDEIETVPGHLYVITMGPMPSMAVALLKGAKIEASLVEFILDADPERHGRNDNDLAYKSYAQRIAEGKAMCSRMLECANRILESFSSITELRFRMICPADVDREIRSLAQEFLSVRLLERFRSYWSNDVAWMSDGSCKRMVLIFSIKRYA